MDTAQASGCTVAMLVDRHLTEPRTSGAMSCLYAAMVTSKANTKKILNGEAGSGSVNGEGNHLAASCMETFDAWLYTLRMYTEPNVFEDAIASPLQMSAKFIQYMRGLSPSSIDVTALVFEVSKSYHDDFTEKKLKTVSAIVPSLESVVYARIGNWEWDDIPGWYVFNGFQPIPLVNRMRPVKGSTITRAEPYTAGMADMGFLYCPLSGIGPFKRSLAMENFCEVGSWQDGGKHILGAPVVLHGRVSSIGHSQISLTGCDNDNAYMSAYLSEGAVRMWPMELTSGDYVRVLTVVWYNADMDPEVYMIEKTDKNGAIAGDAAGLARIEGPISATEMSSRYGYVPRSNLLEQKGDNVVFKRTGQTATVPEKEFVKTVSHIRQMRRQMQGSIHCSPEDVFSDDITDKRISGELGRKEVRDVLLQIIDAKERDQDDSADAFPFIVRKLERLGLVKKSKNVLTVTSSGRGHGYKSAVDVVEGRLGQISEVVFVPDLDTAGIPPSFVLQYLKGEGYRQAEVRGYGCRIVMSREGANKLDLKNCVDRAENLMDHILTIFDEVWHPLEPLYLAEKLKLPRIYIENLLESMVKCKSVQKADRSAFLVTVEDKVMHVLKRDIERAFYKQDIMDILNVPGMDKKVLDNALEKLRKNGAVVEVLKDRWATTAGADAVLEQEIYKIAMDLYESLKSHRSAVSVDNFLLYLNRKLHELGMRGERLKAAREAVDTMKKHGVWVDTPLY